MSINADEQTIVRRFWSKVDIGAADECWHWRPPANRGGYGLFRVGPAKVQAHRFAYQLDKGPIPEGRDLDHLCRNRACVNPAHLEPVSSRENTMRSDVAPAAVNARKTRCVNGHLFDEANTYWRPNGNRDCRACMAERHRRWRQS